MKKEKIGTIKGVELITKGKNKLSRHEGVVKSGAGIHKSPKDYDRKGKKNQQLKNKLKDFGSIEADFFLEGNTLDIDKNKSKE